MTSIHRDQPPLKKHLLSLNTEAREEMMASLIVWKSFNISMFAVGPTSYL